MVWNKELKRLAVAFLIVFGLGILVVNLCVDVYCARVRADYAGFLATVFGNVAAVYPEVQEEKLIQLLDSSGEEERGSTVLARYGLLGGKDNSSFARQEQQLFRARLCANLFLVLSFAVCGSLFCLYLGKRQRRIAGLTGYMESLNHGSYKLEIEDNAEDELSGLRNEIYKLTVQLKEQADRAMEQKRALADSVTDISHQLKTPLTSVTVLVDNLSENADMEEGTRRRFLSEITRQLTGMSWLITTMMKLSRLEAGVVELECERFYMEPFVEGIFKRLELAAEWRQISLAADIPEAAFLSADKRWTEEAVLNIIKNAIEHSPDGGSVEVSGEENDVYTQISVRDHGEGITAEEQSKLFHRFYNGSTSREDSMGIGLALAKEVIEKQGGSVSVDSRKGVGTVFRIRFLKQL